MINEPWGLFLFWVLPSAICLSFVALDLYRLSKISSRQRILSLLMLTDYPIYRRQLRYSRVIGAVICSILPAASLLIVISFCLLGLYRVLSDMPVFPDRD